MVRIKKIQLWSMIKEIGRVIDDWDQQTFQEQINRSEISFAKYFPSRHWSSVDTEKYVVTLKIERKVIDEEENELTGKSAQSIEES